MKSFLTPWLALAFWFVSAAAGFCAENQPIPLIQAQQQLQSEFNRISLEMSRTAVHLGKSGLTGDSARLALQDLCRKFDYAVDCSAVTPQGIMVTVEPSYYSLLEGSDISQQSQIIQVMTQHRPVLSPVFRTIEGVDAADIEYPVFSPGGTFLGSVSLLILPEKMLADHIGSITKGLPVRLWVMEPEGRILHDRDASQIGRNLFTSDFYSPYIQLINMGHTIASSPSGTDLCEFLRTRTNETVQYRFFWQSVSGFGAEWRLVATFAQPKKVPPKAAVLTQEKLAQSLSEFAKNPVLLEALKTDNTPMTLSLFKDFHDSASAIYAIQWINTSYINRLGYPLENSLSNYDFKAARRTADTKFIRIVDEKIRAKFTTQLYEGALGEFLLQPVFDKETYLGMIYTITLP